MDRLEHRIKAQPKKRQAKKKNQEDDDVDDEKVELISIQYKVEDDRPNTHVNNVFYIAAVEDIIGIKNEELNKDNVSFFCSI